MSTITTRSGKGSPLTHTEGDNNFTNLNNDKLENITNENLGDLSNVSSSAPSDGQVLTYNNANSQWEPQTASSGGGGISRAILQSGSTVSSITASTSSYTTLAFGWEEISDTDAIVTTSGNTFTLSSGTYLVRVDLGCLFAYMTNGGTVYWPVIALRNTSDSTNIWGWEGQFSNNLASGTFIQGPTVTFNAYFTIGSSKTFDVAYKNGSSTTSFQINFNGHESDWENNTTTRSPGWVVIEKLA